MSRLIDADALIRDIGNSADLGGALGKVVECVKIYAKFMVQTAPTIEERKTGKWEWSKLPITGALEQKCSICGTPFYMAFRLGMNYCPNCGADMRGGEE